MRSLTPDPVDLGVLPSHAETGIPTVAELARNLAKTAEASAAAGAAASSGRDRPSSTA